ncbi:MAG TPA: polysaccharide biosynthesis/export family protein [Oligoflexus sp.]|uniref:polysaccharide biosynthesis/export family protein n=1 Tax=Oligoflexus sp. TaxID=1971216 RepID=UPI002D372285|nr:polysaccharide biosynthesis/export family protein [Oligoflexus sp.]HYX33126.1 polysaccharide biosynthesis/export family protein [Oligoflexus sp.]
MKMAVRILIVLCALSWMEACTFHIPAEDISQLQAGKTFTRQGGFTIGPGDEIDIVVYGEEKLSGRFTVSPAGILTFPLIAPINVVGMTVAQLTKRLESALDSMVKNPRVTASLLGVRSFSVYFAGEISRIGMVPLTSETTFLQAMTLAGGPTAFATGRIVLIRQVGNNKVRRFSLRYEDILTGEKYIDNITLESGDVIYVE